MEPKAEKITVLTGESFKATPRGIAIHNSINPVRKTTATLFMVSIGNHYLLSKSIFYAASFPFHACNRSYGGLQFYIWLQKGRWGTYNPFPC